VHITTTGLLLSDPQDNTLEGKTRALQNTNRTKKSPPQTFPHNLRLCGNVWGGDFFRSLHKHVVFEATGLEISTQLLVCETSHLIPHQQDRIPIRSLSNKSCLRRILFTKKSCSWRIFFTKKSCLWAFDCSALSSLPIYWY